MVIFGDYILAVFQVPEDMAPDAIAYFQIVMAGIPLVAFTIAYGAILRALGDTITVVIIGILSNILNAVLDPLFIFGWGSFPRMGAGGAAIATVISQAAACVACMALIRKHRAGLVLAAGDLRPDWQVLRQTLSIGTPAAIGNASNSIGFSVFQILVNWLGTTVVGAFTIGFRIINFVNVPGQALAMAASPIVGQALGAGRPDLARRAIKVSMAIVTVSMLPAVALLMWQGQLVARAFAFDKEVVAEAGRFFLIVPASSYLFGAIMVLTAAFTGSGHTRPAMFLAILRLWIVRVPVGYLLAFTLGMGSVGIYWGMVAGNVVSAVAAVLLVRGYKWQTAIIPTTGVDAKQAANVPIVEVVADEPPSA
jgi:putative MATE family efflux protein